MDDLFNSLFNSFFKMNESENFEYPKDGDPKFNKTIEEVDLGNYQMKTEIWKSLDGTKVFKKVSMISKSDQDNEEKQKNKLLKTLEFDLQLAVKNEEYEKAAQIRDQIKKLK
jgi:protein-arginine kinase activator protein McsA